MQLGGPLRLLVVDSAVALVDMEDFAESDICLGTLIEEDMMQDLRGGGVRTHHKP